MVASLKEAFVRSAKARAIIIDEIKSKDKALTLTDILGLEPLAALGMKVPAVQSCVYSMVKSGVLIKSKSDSTTYYGVPTGSVEKAPVKVKTTKYAIQPTKPSIQVDIIKATGRVRLSLNGLVIEIGVE